jgi:hypothetical protein
MNVSSSFFFLYFILFPAHLNFPTFSNTSYILKDKSAFGTRVYCEDFSSLLTHNLQWFL